MNTIHKTKGLSLAAILITSCISMGQEPAGQPDSSDNKLEVTLGTILTEADKWATAAAIDYFKPFNAEEYLIPGQGGFTDFSPEIRIKTGGEDAFDGILVAIRGHYVNSDDITAAFLEEAAGEERVTAVLHVLPFSAGIETNRDFSNGSLLIEGGYAPYVLSNKPDRYKLGLNPFVGVFLQAGYKVWDSPNVGIGGNVDNSAEDDGEAIFRVKSEFRADILLGSFGMMGRKVTMQARPKATGWYDALNSEFYYSIGAELEADLGDDKDFVLQYLKGSGAPNFNEGDQFGAFLKIAF